MAESYWDEWRLELRVQAVWALKQENVRYLNAVTSRETKGDAPGSL